MASYHDSAVFTARYPGVCADCGHDFSPGVEVRPIGTDGELVHADHRELEDWGQQ